ncbi:MAG TPA: helix-turn-helix domain-containing protein [Candidatus Eremiobacteraceae bacterium]|jgi:DNA-binding HxlR family transcriptional regulator|nr:helix-turn-helix domain-containing protein [Candidatus Eremiobacteraceae bacterium]
MTYETKLACPIQRTMAMIADKWKVIVLFHLGQRTMRFGELQRALEGITPKVLTRQLRDLEGDGLVSRRVHAEIPPRVEYSLTDLGRDLLPILDQLHDWATRNSVALLSAREERRKSERTPAA